MPHGRSQNEVYRALHDILEPINKDPQVNRFSCVGYAPSKGRRCMNPVAAHNRAIFADTLYELAGSDLEDSPARIQSLEKLAATGLCVSLHRPQAAEVASRWNRRISSWLRIQSTAATVQAQSPQVSERSRSRTPARTTPPLQLVTPTTIRRVSSPTNTTVPSPLSTPAAQMSPPPTPQVPSPTTVQRQTHSPRSEEVIETIERTSGLGSTRSTRIQPVLAEPARASTTTQSDAGGTPASTTTPRRVGESETSERPELATRVSDFETRMPTTEFTFSVRRHLVPVSRVRAAPGSSRIFTREIPTPVAATVEVGSSSPTQVTEPAVSSAPVQVGTTPSSPPATSAAAPQAANTAGCTQQHARRKPIDDECPVCQEPLASSSRADIVWCKAQCGTNLHRACWAEWERSSRALRGEERPSCVYWYVSPPIFTGFTKANQTPIAAPRGPGLATTTPPRSRLAAVQLWLDPLARVLIVWGLAWLLILLLPALADAFCLWGTMAGRRCVEG